jgi:outer membrane protein OmpA-like peptidoglycan-associated protein
MKAYFKTALAIVLAVLSVNANGQTRKNLEPGYYLVVGAYAASRENIAQNYVDVLSRQGFTSGYGFNPSTRLYLVYVRFHDNLKASLQDMHATRRNEKFRDAWVRVVPGVINAAPVVRKAEPAPVEASTPVMPPAPALSLTETSAPPPPQPAKELVASADTAKITDNEPIKQYQQMTLGNTEVFLSLYNARINEIVQGEVQVIDTDRAKFITKVKGNEYLLLPDPNSRSGRLTLVCEAFGFRKVQEEINYPVPLADTVKPFIDLMGTTIVVKFDLVRYYKGDKAILYNVYFYNDAAIMAPESKYELNSLVQMMKEIPSYKIMLHGHTNGNYHGHIKTIGDDKNFFSLENARTTVGSAKDLSRHRAEVIKEYLVSNGISTDRISVKAWGGKRPLYDKHGANARKNVRVEVEVLNR